MRVAVDDEKPAIDFQIKKSIQSKDKLQSFKQKGLSIWVRNLLENSQISATMFDPRYDNDWSDCTKDSFDFRGSLPIFSNLPNFTPQPYYFPIGYFGYGL